MGFRFRKSFKIASGVRVNLGKKSTGISFGGKGGRISFNTKSGARASTSIPGTGISYSTKLGGSNKKSNRSKKKVQTTSQKVASSYAPAYNLPKQPVPRQGWYIALSIFFVISGMCYFKVEMSAAIVTALVGVVMLCFTFKAKPIPKIDYAQLNRQLQIFNDSFKLMMTTSNPETFFGRYEDSERAALAMANLTTQPIVHEQSPQDILEMLKNDRTIATNAFLDRMAAETRQKAFSLTRGRKQKVETFKLLTLNYENSMTTESIAYRDQLYQKMLDDLKCVET